MEHTKTDVFGNYFFVTDPDQCNELLSSVISISKDGTYHGKLVHDVFTEASNLMQVVHSGSNLFQFLPNRDRNNIGVNVIK